ncbi:class C sortase [uncultured Corynebacterium sp.]|uniref:class C sortase n=1 Tax=uncultured Corynebacterium sp. TaxID=159447 RepID=UPI0025CFED0B|nr:class C sortase [uncultured Corynebacterium sp.]
MSTSTQAEQRGRTAPVWARVLIPVLIIAIGLGVLLYPVVATQWNNNKQITASREYEDLNQQTDPATLQGHIDAARQYNETEIGGPILDPWLSRVSVDNEQYQRYLAELNYQQAMSRLVIPSIDVDLPIFHGTSDETLQQGVGHLYGSALPVGGEGSHSMLTAHTGLSQATLFDNLDDVVVGDVFYLSTAGERFKYEVHNIDTVLPDQAENLHPVAGEDLVTLITCTPYGINTHRILVTGHRVEMDLAAEKVLVDGVDLKWQWWMYAIAAAAIITILLLALWASRMVRKSESNLSTDDQEESL